MVQDGAMVIMARIPSKTNLRTAALAALLAATWSPLGTLPVQAQSTDSAPAAPVVQGPIPGTALTYVDLVELGRASDMVLRAQIEDQTNVPPERAPGLAPGKARLYVEAVTQALLAGSGPVGGAQAFLVDLPLDARGRRPRTKEQVVLLFARRVANRPGQIQLVGPNAIQPYDPVLEQRVRHVLTQVVQNERPPMITGVREVMSVPGNLAGESETQVFLETQGGDPVSITVLRRPGQAPNWGVSWTDIVDQAARPPAAETLQWYALACYLPPELPPEAFIQNDPESRTRAREDYALVLRQLGACQRSGN